MERPQILPTSARDVTYAGFTYHLDGELVPMLTVELTEGQSIFFEHHILLWKHPAIQIGIRAMKGMLKRMIAGMQVFITEATVSGSNQGQIAFSRDGAGHILALHLEPGEELDVREHQFLAATDNIDYSFERIRGVSNLLFGGTGFFIDKFRGERGHGILWLHGYGNVFEKVLADGEQIDIEPGAWLYKDPSVRMETTVNNLPTGFLASTTIIMNRFTGPGRIGLQSMSLLMPEANN